MFTILFAIEVRRVQLKSVNILKISAKHFIFSHLMLSVLFNKDRIRLFVSNRHTRNDGDTHKGTDPYHKTAFRQAQIQIHTTDGQGLEDMGTQNREFKSGPTLG